MRQTEKSKTVEPPFFIGATVFTGLTLFFCAELLLFLTREKPFHLLWIICLSASALTSFFILPKLSLTRARRVRQFILGLIVITSALCIQNNDIPLSTISITVSLAPGASTVLMHQVIPGQRKTDIKAYIPSGAGSLVTLHFPLIKNLRRNDRPLTLYFARRQSPYLLEKISFSTQVLWWPVPLISFEGSSLPEIAVPEQATTKAELFGNMLQLSSKVHSRPTLKIIPDGDQVFELIQPARIYALKFFWFLLCTGCSALILWRPAGVLPAQNNRTGWLTSYLTG